jgi:valyl-tRNA synthetase
VEATKLSMKWTSTGGGLSDSAAEKDRAATVLLDVLARSLRLIHPLLSFVTEEIYAKLPNKKPGELLITAAYPVYDEKLKDEKTEKDFAFLKEIIRQIRTLRSECTVPPERKIKVLLRSPNRESILRENEALLKLLAGIGEMELSSRPDKPQGSIGLAGNEFEAFVFIAEAVDLTVLRQKFQKELGKDSKFAESLEAKLANANFLKNAPPELVSAERLKLEAALKRKASLESYIRDMA